VIYQLFRSLHLLSILCVLLLVSIVSLGVVFNSINTISSSNSLLALNPKLAAAYAEGSANNIDKDNLIFGDPVNISNNTRDSVYSQIATYKNNVYVVWEEDTAADFTTNKQELPTSSSTNYDIYFKKSTDGGVTFSKAIDISNNAGFSQHPQIAVSGSNVYLAWTDDMSHNKEILFRMSSDEGNSFGRTIKLSDGIGESYNQEISSYGNNVYVVWENKFDNTNHINTTSDTNTIGISNDVNSASHAIDAYGVNNNRILFKASTDGGNSFKNAQTITTNLRGIADLYPKIAASQNDVYITWSVGMPTSRVEDRITDYSNNKSVNNNNDNNSGIEQKQGIYFTKSSNSGQSFTNSVRLNGEASHAGESQIAASGNQVYVVWSGNSDNLIPNDLYFIKSIDNGNSFTDEISLSKKSSLNAELAVAGNNVYIIWQDFLRPTNQEILIKKSTDGGNTFTDTSTNISNNKGTSECPSIAISKNIIYTMWEDNTPGNHEIYFSTGSNYAIS
jgi:hypothetical protein